MPYLKPLQIMALSIPLLVLALPAHASPRDLAEVEVDVSEEGQPLRAVLERLEEAHGLNYVVSQRALDQAGPVTVRLRGVSLDVALEAICAACGLEVEFRGPVIVIVPREAGGSSTDRRETTRNEPRRDGLLAREPEPRTEPTPRTTPELPDLGVSNRQAVGDVVEVDLEEGRLRMRASGALRDFYAPAEAAEFAQAERLRAALARLRLGDRVALLYRRIDGRSVITDLVGGTRLSERPAFDETPRERRGERAQPPQPTPEPETQPETQPDPAQPTTPEPTPEPTPVRRPAILESEGVISGRFVERAGEEVVVRLDSGEEVVVYMPGREGNRERWDLLDEAIGGLRADARVLFVCESVEGRVVITNSILESN